MGLDARSVQPAPPGRCGLRDRSVLPTAIRPHEHPLSDEIDKHHMVPQKVASQKAGGREVSGIVLYQESMNGVAESGINRNKAASLLLQTRMDVLARHGCCGIRNAVGKREGNGRPGVKHHIMGLASDYRFQNKPLL